jgi:serine/threonine protein kinase
MGSGARAYFADPHDDEAPADALLGRVVAGKLRVDAVLGSGAMGHVYRARHLALDKDVAIKVLRQPYDPSVESSRRFAREARAASRLDHPNSVAILDFGEDGPDRLLYIAMELVEGEDVQAIIDRTGALPLRRTLDVMVQALGAVAAAHDQGVIHRDLKPSNLIVARRTDDDGRALDFVKVCDFGLAKFVSSSRESMDGSAASAARVVGTPAYMSPEQAVGDALDVRTDLYSCGVILFEMLTGQLPFDADTAMGVMLKHVSEPPVPPSQLAPHLPPAVDDVVLWALEKPRERRCQTARALRQALQQLRAHLSDAHVAAPRTPRPRVETPTPAVPFDLVSDLALELPRPGPDSGVLPAPRKSASDLDMEALVNEAVQSIGHEAQSSASTPEAHSLLAGLDAGASDLAKYLWNQYGIAHRPHAGPHPFFVRDHRGKTLGPLELREALEVVRAEGLRGEGQRVAISGQTQQPMPAMIFAKLTGQESLLDREVHGRRGDLGGGDLEQVSLPNLFARLTREHATGRLLFLLRTDQGEVACELHLVQGQPTFAYANLPGLQLPNLMVAQGLLQDRLLPGLMQVVLATEQRLEAVVARETGLDLRPYTGVFMRERLGLVFKNPRGTFEMDPHLLPARSEPFALSLMAVLPDLVYRFVPPLTLSRAIDPLLSARARPTELFPGGIRHLRLTSGQTEIVQRILRAETLGAAVPPDGKGARTAYAMAYILLESGLLKV